MNCAQLPSSALAPALPLGLLRPGARFVLPLDRRADFAASSVSPIRPPFVFVVLKHDRDVRMVAVQPEGAGPVHRLLAATLVRPLIGPPALHRSSQPALPGTAASDRTETPEEDAYEAEREFMRTGASSIAAELAADARGRRTAPGTQEGDYASPV